ncbi:hypothetical protein AB3S75_024078 [Citrus x aurantiifolia]
MPISWFLSVYDYGTLAAAVVQLIGILHCLSSVPKLGLMIAITMFIEGTCFQFIVISYASHIKENYFILSD